MKLRRQKEPRRIRERMALKSKPKAAIHINRPLLIKREKTEKPVEMEVIGEPRGEVGRRKDDAKTDYGGPRARRQRI